VLEGSNESKAARETEFLPSDRSHLLPFVKKKTQKNANNNKTSTRKLLAASFVAVQIEEVKIEAFSLHIFGVFGIFLFDRMSSELFLFIVCAILMFIN
jgi:hypothetical protein